MKMMAKSFLLAVAGCLTWANAAVTMDFEGIPDLTPVGNYYNGGGGPNYGIYFSEGVLAALDSDVGGSANSANEPSPETVIASFGTDYIMNVPAGFTSGFSLFYSTPYNPGFIRVYSELDGAGTLLGSAELTPTGIGVGDPNGEYYAIWNEVGVPFAGTAKSVIFGGDAVGILFDNLSVGVELAAPEIDVTDSVDPDNDLTIPFGLVEIGSASQTETITVTNSGTDDLIIGSVTLGEEVMALENPNIPEECKAAIVSEECKDILKQNENQPEIQPEPEATDFLITADNCTEEILAPGASCTIDVQFVPQGSCFRTAVVYIDSSDADESTVGVMLEGIAKGDYGNDIHVSPYFGIYFPFTLVGQTSAPRKVLLFNATSTQKTIDEVGLIDGDEEAFGYELDYQTEPFDEPCGELPRVLDPYESCVLIVFFEPEMPGLFSSTLGVFSEDTCAFRDVTGRTWGFNLPRFKPVE